METQDNFAVLKYQNLEYALPILKSTIGANAIDITKLYKDLGVVTYDPGFMSTASCESKITYIDGSKGILKYRGYAIEDLAADKDFMDVSYLLLYGDLPNTSEKEKFIAQIDDHLIVSEQVPLLLQGFKREAHPMAMMISAVGALSSFYPDSSNIRNKDQQEISTFRLIAKMPILAAMIYRYTNGLPFISPRKDLGYVENFLYMTFGDQMVKFTPDPVVTKALDKIFILHADHEQNASTSAVRLVGSTGANPFACITAGISSMWGPLHGGANEAVIRMLEGIDDIKNIPHYISRAKDKSDSFRLMGFGHRVYKNRDPRGEVIRKICYEILSHLDQMDNKLFKIALELERVALNDEYFIERKLYPNVDFYSGIIYKALGIPFSMYTVLFSIARTVGWVAQWREMVESSEFKIGRPRQLYTGHVSREFK